MEPAVQPPLLHKREVYRLWFEYLKVAMACRKPEVVDHLKNSTPLYAAWEVTPDTVFNDWWKTHHHLFAEQHEVRVLKPGEMPSDPALLIIQVPLTMSPTLLTRRIKGLIQGALAERDTASGTSRKSKKAPSSRYRPTDGAEPKLLAVREMLTVYRDVYLKNPKIRGEALLKAVHDFYRTRKSKRWAKVPMALQVNNISGNTTAMRNLRRYIQKAELVMTNVARGEFPGKY